MEPTPDALPPELAALAAAAAQERASGLAPTPLELAEAAWLAQFFPAGPEAVELDAISNASAAFGQATDPQHEDAPGAKVTPGSDDEHGQQTPEPRPTKKTIGPEPGSRPVYVGTPSTEISPHQVSAGAFRSPTGRAVRAARELAGALRFLQRSVADPATTVIDEEATVDRWAEQRLHYRNRRVVLAPETRPGTRRAWEIALLVDTAPSMAVWQEVARELAEMLAWHGAFRDVRIWALDSSSPEHVPGVRPWNRGAPGGAAEDRHPAELLTARGDRLLVVLTDGTAPAWTDGLALDLLADWGRSASVAVWQVLPERLWGQTAFGNPRWLATAGEPGQPNTSWTVLPRPGECEEACEGDPVERKKREAELQKTVPVPIIALTSAALLPWARAMAGLGRAWVPVVRVLPEKCVLSLPAVSRGAAKQKVAGATEAGADPTAGIGAEERVKLFDREASPLARRLARVLAYVPLSLPVMRVVQAALLPTSDQSHLAEVLLGGLLTTPKEPGAEQFEFHSGVQPLLAAATPQSEVLKALVEVGRYLELSDATLQQFDAYVGDEPEIGEGEARDGRIAPYAVLRRQALVRFGLLPSKPVLPDLSILPDISILPQPPLAPPVRRYWALLIGIDHFADPEAYRFHYSAQEARELARLLASHGYTTEVLVNEVATREAIRAAVTRLRGQAAAGDLVYIHASGYGAIGTDGPGLATYEADWERLVDTVLPLRKLWDGWPEGTDRVLSLDAGSPPFIAEAADEFPGTFLGAGLNEDRNLGYGVLSFFLIQALREPPAAGTTGGLNVGQLVQRVQEGLTGWLGEDYAGETTVIRGGANPDALVLPPLDPEVARPRTVLMVDRSPASNRRFWKELRGYGLDVVVAVSAADARLRIQRGEYFALIWNMTTVEPLFPSVEGVVPALHLLQFAREFLAGSSLGMDSRRIFFHGKPRGPIRDLEAASQHFVIREDLEQLLPELLRVLEDLPPEGSSPVEETPPPAELEPRIELSGQPSITGRLAWSPTHRCLAVGLQDGSVHLWDPETGVKLAETEKSNPIDALAWSPTEALLAFNGPGGSVELWTPGERARVSLGSQLGRRLFDLAWSPDGSKLFAVGSLGICAVLELLPPTAARSTLASRVQATTRLRLEAPAIETFYTAAWSPGGATLAAGGQSLLSIVRPASSIYLWQRVEGEITRAGELHGHENRITQIAFHPHDRLLASASRDRTVRIWDLEGSRELVLRGHEQAVVSISWAPDGRTLASRSLDGTVRLWDPSTGHEVARQPATVPVKDKWAAVLAFHPQAPVLAVGDPGPGRVGLWNLGGFAGPLPGVVVETWATLSAIIHLTSPEPSELVMTPPQASSAPATRELVEIVRAILEEHADELTDDDPVASLIAETHASGFTAVSFAEIQAHYTDDERTSVSFQTTITFQGEPDTDRPFVADTIVADVEGTLYLNDEGEWELEWDEISARFLREIDYDEDAENGEEETGSGAEADERPPAADIDGGDARIRAMEFVLPLLGQHTASLLTQEAVVSQIAKTKAANFIHDTTVIGAATFLDPSLRSIQFEALLTFHGESASETKQPWVTVVLHVDTEGIASLNDDQQWDVEWGKVTARLAVNLTPDALRRVAECLTRHPWWDRAQSRRVLLLGVLLPDIPGVARLVRRMDLEGPPEAAAEAALRLLQDFRGAERQRSALGVLVARLAGELSEDPDRRWLKQLASHWPTDGGSEVLPGNSRKIRGGTSVRLLSSDMWVTHGLWLPAERAGDARPLGISAAHGMTGAQVGSIIETAETGQHVGEVAAHYSLESDQPNLDLCAYVAADASLVEFGIGPHLRKPHRIYHPSRYELATAPPQAIICTANDEVLGRVEQFYELVQIDRGYFIEGAFGVQTHREWTARGGSGAAVLILNDDGTCDWLGMVVAANTTTRRVVVVPAERLLKQLVADGFRFPGFYPAVEIADPLTTAPASEDAPLDRPLKIMIVGSEPDGGPEEFRRACRELGRAIAERGHSLTVNSWNPVTADRHVVYGANQVADRSTPIAWMLAPGDELPGQVSEWLPNVAHSVVAVPGARVDRFRHQMEMADVIVAIGGKRNTRWVSEVAGSLRPPKPVVAVAAFGGTARQVWTEARELYVSEEIAPEDVARLGSDWSDQSAAAVVRVAESLAAAASRA